jgi:hypothetical protein
MTRFFNETSLKQKQGRGVLTRAERGFARPAATLAPLPKTTSPRINPSAARLSTTSESSVSARLPLVLTAGGVPSRLPTLSACESVASRKRSSRAHRDNTRTDAILVAFASASLRVWCAREDRTGRQRAKDWSVSGGPRRVIYKHWRFH